MTKSKAKYFEKLRTQNLQVLNFREKPQRIMDKTRSLKRARGPLDNSSLLFAKELSEVTAEENERKEAREDGNCCRSVGSWMCQYFFFFSLLIIMVLSIIMPQFGREDGPLYPHITASWVCTISILFLSGMSVDTKQLQNAAMDLKINSFAQFSVYILFPMNGYALCTILLNAPIIYILFNKNLMMGLIILCCLPTSTTSPLVFTQSANGNDSSAIVNMIIASVIGPCFVTPGLIFLMIGNTGNASIANLLIKLTARVIGPFVIGQIGRCLGGKLMSEWLMKKYVKFILKKIREFAILFLIFCALSRTFYNGFDATLLDVIIAAVLIAFLNVFNGLVTYMLSGMSLPKCICCGCICCGHICCKCNSCNSLDIGDRISILFVAMMKSVAVGIPIIETIYENDDNVGLYILPVILYYPIQVFTASIIVRPLAKKVERFEQMDDVGMISEI